MDGLEGRIWVVQVSGPLIVYGFSNGSNPKRVDGMDLFLSRVTTMICIPQSRGKTFLQAID